MGKGYAEGPAAEAAEEERERLAAGPPPPGPSSARASSAPPATTRSRASCGWADDVDPDALFDSGQAWGLSVRLVAA